MIIHLFCFIAFSFLVCIQFVHSFYHRKGTYKPPRYQQKSVTKPWHERGKSAARLYRLSQNLPGGVGRFCIRLQEHAKGGWQVFSDFAATFS